MVAVNKIIFTIITIFFIIFYFFILPLPKLINKYETYIQKQYILDYIKEENYSIERKLAELDNQNIDSLKYILNVKNENEIFVKFDEKEKEIKKYKFREKNLLNLLYYLFGITIFTIIFINIIFDEEYLSIPSSIKKKSRYYYN